MKQTDVVHSGATDPTLQPNDTDAAHKDRMLAIPCGDRYVGLNGDNGDKTGGLW